MDHSHVMKELASVDETLRHNSSLDDIRARIGALQSRMPSLSPERTLPVEVALSSEMEMENRLLKDLLRASVLHNRLLSTENRTLRELVESFLNSQ